MRRKLSISRRLIVLKLFTIAGFAAAFSLGSTQAQEEVAAEVRKVVAKVNGQPIYEEQLKPAVASALRKFSRYGIRKDNSDLVKRVQAKALNNAIDTSPR